MSEEWEYLTAAPTVISNEAVFIRQLALWRTNRKKPFSKRTPLPRYVSREQQVDRWLNQMGAQGWQVVRIDGGKYLFQRRKK